MVLSIIFWGIVVFLLYYQRRTGCLIAFVTTSVLGVGLVAFVIHHCSANPRGCPMP